jgi:Tfp pilus assembly protein PilW
MENNQSGGDKTMTLIELAVTVIMALLLLACLGCMFGAFWSAFFPSDKDKT